MNASVTYPHIEKPAGEPARLSRVPRTRVATIVMEYLAHGYSADEMVRQFPYLQISEVHSAMGYYFDHQDEIDAEILKTVDDLKAWNGQHQPAPVVLRLRALRDSNGQ
jgi:hypothetical protein